MWRTCKFVIGAGIIDRTAQGLAEGNVHLNISTGRRGVHCRGYPADVTLHDPPLRIPEYRHRNRAALQILLRLDVLVRRKQNLESGLLRGLKKFAIRQIVPTHVPCFRHNVACEKWNERRWRTMIKNNAHRQVSATGRREAAYRD